jgi:hypothetical protein
MRRPIGTILLLVVFFGAVMLLPREADALKRPAPRYLVVAAVKHRAPAKGSVERRAWVICRVWGAAHCRGALNVAWCESGLRPWARNGQYLGIWQMGSSERARFGHGSNAWSQTRAAKAYWRLSGWRPWQCRP